MECWWSFVKQSDCLPDFGKSKSGFKQNFTQSNQKIVTILLSPSVYVLARIEWSVENIKIACQKKEQK